MFKGMASTAALLREVEALRAEVKALRNEQVKKERDMEDLLHNLDYENVPVFNSKNFKVDADGNMECGNAKIRGSSTIGSNLKPGEGSETAMLFGPVVAFTFGEDDEYVTESATRMRIVDSYDTQAGAAYTRGIAFVSTLDRERNADGTANENRKTIHGGVVSDPKIAGAFMSKDDRHTMRPDYDQAFVGLERPVEGSDGIRVILRNINKNASLENLEDEITALWIDDEGHICTNASAIQFGCELPLDLQ